MPLLPVTVTGPENTMGSAEIENSAAPLPPPDSSISVTSLSMKEVAPCDDKQGQSRRRHTSNKETESMSKSEEKIGRVGSSLTWLCREAVKVSTCPANDQKRAPTPSKPCCFLFGVGSIFVGESADCELTSAQFGGGNGCIPKWCDVLRLVLSSACFGVL